MAQNRFNQSPFEGWWNFLGVRPEIAQKSRMAGKDTLGQLPVSKFQSCGIFKVSQNQSKGSNLITGRSQKKITSRMPKIHMDFGQEKFKNSNLPRGKRMTVREQFFKTGSWPLGGVGVVQLLAYPTARVIRMKMSMVFIFHLFQIGLYWLEAICWMI